nr:helix-turn-helix transcriptional regulator [Nocardia terpenica]
MGKGAKPIPSSGGSPRATTPAQRRAFGQRLRKVRVRLGLTQMQVYKDANGRPHGPSDQTLRDIENGRVEPNPETLRQLETRYGLPSGCLTDALYLGKSIPTVDREVLTEQQPAIPDEDLREFMAAFAAARTLADTDNGPAVQDSIQAVVKVATEAIKALSRAGTEASEAHEKD